GGQGPRLLIRPKVFSDVLVGDGVRTVSVVAVEPPEIDLFPASDQRLWKGRRLVKGVVPPTLALTDIGTPVTGNHDVHDHQVGYRLRVSDGERVGNDAAHVMADHAHQVVPELVVNEPPDVSGNRLLVVAGPGARGVSEAPQVRGDNPITRPGQRRNDLLPAVPRLRPTMQQNDWVSRARRHVVQTHLPKIGVVVLEQVCIGHECASLLRLNMIWWTGSAGRSWSKSTWGAQIAADSGLPWTRTSGV